MSYDHQSPSDRADMEPDEPDAVCEDCGEFLDATEVNVEAFEATGQMLCAGCANEAFEAMHPIDEGLDPPDPDRLREDRDERRKLDREP